MTFIRNKLHRSFNHRIYCMQNCLIMRQTFQFFNRFYFMNYFSPQNFFFSSSPSNCMIREQSKKSADYR